MFQRIQNRLMKLIQQGRNETANAVVYYTIPLEDRMKRVAVQDLTLVLTEVARLKKEQADQLEELRLELYESNKGHW